MSVKVEKLEKNQVRVDITIDAEVAKKEYAKVISQMKKQINIPGFRKGKAPDAVVEKYASVERIKINVVENLFPNEFGKAVSENELDLALQPQIEKFTFDLGKDLTITAIAELKPEVELAKYKDNTIEFSEYKAPENALELELDAIRTRFSTVKNVEEDRPANDKDLVVIDFEGFTNGEKIERGDGKNYTLDLGHSNFIPGFAEGIVGHKKGEDFTIDVTFPEDYAEEKLKGAKAQFKIKIHQIQERILPELTDELAKKVGKFDTAEALKNDISKYIEQSTNSENEKRKMEAIFNKVCEDTKIDIQEAMINREIEAVFNEIRQTASAQGQDFDQLVKAQGEDTVNAQAKEEAIRRIRNSLIIEKIAKSEGIKINQNDIVEQVSAIAYAYKTSPQEILKEVTQNNHFFTAITQQAAIKKVNDILLKNNTFVAK